MGLLGVLGVIAIVVGFLALFNVLNLSLAIAILCIVIGLLLVVFGTGVQNRFTR